MKRIQEDEAKVMSLVDLAIQTVRSQPHASRSEKGYKALERQVKKHCFALLMAGVEEE
jgi:hypothetical protein